MIIFWCDINPFSYVNTNHGGTVQAMYISGRLFVLKQGHAVKSAVSQLMLPVKLYSLQCINMYCLVDVCIAIRLV